MKRSLRCVLRSMSSTSLMCIFLQIIILVSHHVLTDKASPVGYQLLQCMRRFQILDMYCSLEVQTEDTLGELSQALADWEKIIQVCNAILYYTPILKHRRDTRISIARNGVSLRRTHTSTSSTTSCVKGSLKASVRSHTRHFTVQLGRFIIDKQTSRRLRDR